MEGGSLHDIGMGPLPGAAEGVSIIKQRSDAELSAAWKGRLQAGSLQQEADRSWCRCPGEQGGGWIQSSDYRDGQEDAGTINIWRRNCWLQPLSPLSLPTSKCQHL